MANTLRCNLDNERREKEQLEQEAEEFIEDRTDLHDRFTTEIQGLKERLEGAQQDCIKLKETCETLEQAKDALEKQLEDEHEKFNSQLESKTTLKTPLTITLLRIEGTASESARTVLSS